MKWSILLAAVFFVGCHTDEIAQEPPPDEIHRSWDEMLQKYVDAKGWVSYRQWLEEKDRLKAYLDTVAHYVPDKHWDRRRAMAYWINLYNAATVYAILQHYPLKSIREIDNGRIWKRKWIRVGNKKLSLDQIEHERLRKQYGDARIHFAVNCAARSCPPLWNRAFTADQLDQQLEQRTRAFINDPSYNFIHSDSIRISKIFDWYRSDFGNLIDFLNRYSTTTIHPNAQISFTEYDWSLNGE